MKIELESKPLVETQARPVRKSIMAFLAGALLFVYPSQPSINELLSSTWVWQRYKERQGEIDEANLNLLVKKPFTPIGPPQKRMNFKTRDGITSLAVKDLIENGEVVLGDDPVDAKKLLLEIAILQTYRHNKYRSPKRY